MKRTTLVAVIAAAAVLVVIVVAVIAVNLVRSEAAKQACAERYPAGSMDYFACVELAG